MESGSGGVSTQTGTGWLGQGCHCGHSESEAWPGCLWGGVASEGHSSAGSLAHVRRTRWLVLQVLFQGTSTTYLSVEEAPTLSEPSSEEEIFGASKLKKKKTWFISWHQEMQCMTIWHRVYEEPEAPSTKAGAGVAATQSLSEQGVWVLTAGIDCCTHRSMSSHPAHLAIVNMDVDSLIWQHTPRRHGDMYLVTALHNSVWQHGC